MDDQHIVDIPAQYNRVLRKSEAIGFTMPSDVHIGSLLKTLIASKPQGRFLELGTGTGLSLLWMIDGMDRASEIISIDNDADLIAFAKTNFKDDARVSLVCQDGAKFITTYKGALFDLVFADAWPGKYSELDLILNLIKDGGLYVIDDMSPQPNWPKGHAHKATALIAQLEQRDDIVLTKLNWSTGIIIATKKATA